MTSFSRGWDRDGGPGPVRRIGTLILVFVLAFVAFAGLFLLFQILGATVARAEEAQVRRELVNMQVYYCEVGEYTPIEVTIDVEPIIIEEEPVEPVIEVDVDDIPLDQNCVWLDTGTAGSPNIRGRMTMYRTEAYGRITELSFYYNVVMEGARFANGYVLGYVGHVANGQEYIFESFTGPYTGDPEDYVHLFFKRNAPPEQPEFKGVDAATIFTLVEKHEAGTALVILEYRDPKPDPEPEPVEPVEPEPDPDVAPVDEDGGEEGDG